MAQTTFSGPILAGDIKNTTGTVVGENVKNTGQVLMAQSFSVAFGQEGAATDTNVVIPANSQIVRIDVNVETAFNDSGSDILEVGSSADTDLYVNDVDISAVGKIALGTDFPVEKVNPLNTFYSAVARRDTEGKPVGGYQMENALTRSEALKGMTIWAAYANFEEQQKGSIEVGKVADLVLLTEDIMTINESAILSAEVLATIVDGNIVYKRKK